MGGSSKQTVGYKYFAGLQVALGNCIERILNINPDNRGWILSDRIYQDILKEGDVSLGIAMPNIFGGDKQEGGWVGMIEIHTGRPEYIRQNAYLAEHDSELVSSFPYLSYVVFKGYTIDKGFQLVSMSGMLKEVLYWPKRTRIKDDGSVQWYKSYINEDGTEIIVCEIGAMRTVTNPDQPPKGTLIDYIDKGKIVATSGTHLYTNTGSFSSQDSITLRPLFNSGDNGYPGSLSITNKTFIPSVKFMGIVKFRLSLLKSAKTVSVELPGIVTKSRSWSNEFWSYFDYECLFLDGNFSINIVQEADDENEVGASISNITIDLVPTKSYSYRDRELFDINPIHKIREILTDYTAMNKPESDINDENFKFAARRIWDEGLGVSGAFTEKSCKDAIDELLYHIEAGIRVNRQTGLYEVILFRDDLLDLDNAQVFNESNIKSFNIEVANIDDMINSVNVNYYDRDNIKDSSFSLDEIGSILSSQSNAETIDFPYFMNRRNAELVGNWKLKQLSTPTRKGSFTTGKYDARKINRYDVIKLSWLNQGFADLLVRIMKIGLGDGIDNTVTLDWVEVIPYSSINYPSINVDQSTSVVLPPQSNQSIAFEMPYLEAVQRFGQSQVDAELANNPDLGYLMVATKKPQNNSINALLYTDNGTGYEEASLVNYCPTATLDQNIGYLDSSFAVKNVASISQAEIGTLILCNEELMVYQSYDDVTKILTVKRAALDTVPKPHLQGAAFYFYDSFSAFDSEQYVLSEVINAKVLTTTPSGIQRLGDVTALSVEMNARAIRPYPPANVKIDDVYYKESLDANQHIFNLTWSHRNRTQQTGGNILGYFDSGVALETGTTYLVELFEVDEVGVETQILNLNVGNVSSYDVDITGSMSKLFKIQLTSIRDGYRSFQSFNHVIRTFDKTVKFIFDESEIYNPPAANAVNFIL